MTDASDVTPIIQKLREFVEDGNDGTFGTVAMHGSSVIGGRVSALLAEVDTLTRERDEAVRDARRWREFTQGINRVHDSGFDECVIRYDTSELAHLAVTDIRNVLDAARTADAEATP